MIVPVGPPELRDLGADAEALRRALVHEIDEATAAREALEQEGPVVEAIRRELAARTDAVPLGVTIAGVLRPAEGVLAGDFWDRIPLTDGRAAAVICDVSGHGPRAGIVAMRLKTSITLGLVAGQDPPQILHRACDAFADEPGRFATAAILIADVEQGRGPVGQRRAPRAPDHPGRRHDRAAGHHGSDDQLAWRDLVDEHGGPPPRRRRPGVHRRHPREPRPGRRGAGRRRPGHPPAHGRRGGATTPPRSSPRCWPRFASAPTTWAATT